MLPRFRRLAIRNFSQDGQAQTSSRGKDFSLGGDSQQVVGQTAGDQLQAVFGFGIGSVEGGSNVLGGGAVDGEKLVAFAEFVAEFGICVGGGAGGAGGGAGAGGAGGGIGEGGSRVSGIE